METGLDFADVRRFDQYVKEAQGTDLSDIQRCILRGKDADGIHVISIIPSLGMKSSSININTFLKSLLLLFVRVSHEVVSEPYTLVYAHAGSLPTLKYPMIYKFYSILPRSFKKNIQKMYIIHPNKVDILYAT